MICCATPPSWLSNATSICSTSLWLELYSLASSFASLRASRALSVNRSIFMTAPMTFTFVRKLAMKVYHDECLIARKCECDIVKSLDSRMACLFKRRRGERPGTHKGPSTPNPAPCHYISDDRPAPRRRHGGPTLGARRLGEM